MSNSLPDKGWTGYGRPGFVSAAEMAQRLQQEAVYELVAEYRLRHDGIKPELLAYLRGIGESVR